MHAISRLFLVSCLVLAVGCAKSLVVSNVSGSVLPKGAPIYVAVAEDGRHGDKVYEGSGLLAAVAVAQALEPYTSSRLVGLARESRDEALASASRAGADYLFYPRIVRWEDRTLVSARPEAAEVHVSAVEVPTGRTVSEAQLVGQGRVMLKSSSPQEQLAEPLADWAAKVFAAPAD